ncbi:MAG: hypothetical protein QMD97_01785 [Candidatus Aenigmarchaeota archaeon]|nr:hypothetical protein [Candidatus Aenigmarchaeota archaeon]
MSEEFTYNEKRSKLRSFAGFLRTFFSLSKEEWRDLDHKLLRIGVGVTTFVVMALFWLYFLRNVTPFKF